MRKGWEYKKLGEVGQIVTGSTPSTKDESNYSPKEYCFVKPSDLPSQGIADIEETEYFVSQVGLSKSRVLPAGSVLVSCIGSIGKIGILTKEACSNQQINAIIPQDETDSRFIAYSVYAQRFVLESIANAPVVPIINKTDFSKIRIGIPPKSTQLAIVSELDKINELIRLKKEQLKDFDNLAQSLFYEMFGDPVENEKGWEVKKLGEICEVVTGTTPKTNIPEYWGKGHYWVTPAELNDTAVYIDRTEREITDEALSKTKLRLLPVGTVLLSSRAPIGKVAITKVEMYCNQGFKNCICSDSICNKYLFYFLRMMKEYLNSLGRGATFKEISKSIVECIRIPLPPLSLQRLFAQRIEQIEREKSEVQKSIQDLETLLASRMQYWFE